jgi:hypothetical protein
VILTNVTISGRDLVDCLNPSELHELYDALNLDDLCSFFDLIDRGDAGEHCNREHTDE